MEPSPTAEATRFTDPYRTSPTAKTPGRLDSRNIGSRRSGQSPAGLAVLQEVGPGHHEPRLIAAHGIGQPLGARLGSDQDEQGSRPDRFGPTGFQIGKGQAFQAVLPGAAGHRDAAADGDVGGGVDLPDEVLRHAVRQRAAPDEQCHLRSVFSEVDRCLPGGVGATHHEDLAALHGLGL